MSTIAQSLEQVRARMAEAARRAGRDPASVELVAVSKTQPAQAIREAYAAGQRVFGENYAQELRDKARELADLKDLRFHFIGRLQKNKAKYVAPVATLVETVDSLDLAAELDRRAAAAGRVLPVLVEINLGEEQKGGIPAGELERFREELGRFAHLRLEGVMCIPPPSEDLEPTRRHFRTVAGLARARGLPVVSMGMSADYEVAIEEGATLVRVGTAIFGARKRA